LRGVTNRAWLVQGTCARTGEGLYDGVDWLAGWLAGQANRQKALNGLCISND
jgi:hypothetical protein